MRNLNKFIAENNYEVITAGKYVVTVKKEEVTIRITRHGVNNYNVTFIKNDRRYSYKCQTQKEVISSIENDIAYHDSEIKEAANEMTLDEQLDTKEFKDLTVNRDDAQYKEECQEHERINFEYNQMVNNITKENEFAEFEKSLNETKEYKEVISANNAHMNNADRLQAAVSRTFGTNVTILNSNERYLLIRYDNGGSAEFATFIHDLDTIKLGHYFTAWGVDENDWSNEEYKKARDSAIADYYERCDINSVKILGGR